MRDERSAEILELGDQLARLQKSEANVFGMHERVDIPFFELHSMAELSMSSRTEHQAYARGGSKWCYWHGRCSGGGTGRCMCDARWREWTIPTVSWELFDGVELALHLQRRRFLPDQDIRFQKSDRVTAMKQAVIAKTVTSTLVCTRNSSYCGPALDMSIGRNVLYW